MAAERTAERNLGGERRDINKERHAVAGAAHAARV